MNVQPYLKMSPDDPAGGGGGSGAPAPGSFLSSVPDPAPTPPPSPSSAPGVPPPPQITYPENWKEGLPEEFRNDPTVKNLTDIPNAIKMLVHQSKMIGADKFQVPGKNASPEDWKQVFQKLGLPDAVENYKLELPNGSEFDEKFITDLRNEAFKAGILPNQLNSILGWYHQANTEAMTKMEADIKAQTAADMANLQKEWGQAFNENTQMAKRAAMYAASKIGMDQQKLFTWLNSTGMGDDPTMIKLLHMMGGFLKEDGIHGGEFIPTQKTPKELDGQISTLQGDKAYWDKEHPGHKKAVDDMAQLMAQRYPAAPPLI